MLIYVAGKYSDNGKANGERKHNIQKAKDVAVQLWNMGYGVLCPHMNTAYFDDDPNMTIGWKQFLDKDCEFISRFDAVFLLDNWEESEGARIEEKHARKYGVPIVKTIEQAKKLIAAHHTTCSFCGLTRNGCTTYYPSMSVCRGCRQKMVDLKPLYWYQMTEKFIPVPKAV